jgi:hypothetical protein
MAVGGEPLFVARDAAMISEPTVAADAGRPRCVLVVTGPARLHKQRGYGLRRQVGRDAAFPLIHYSNVPVFHHSSLRNESQCW